MIFELWGNIGLRKGRYKLWGKIESNKADWKEHVAELERTDLELFDLSQDIAEQNDLRKGNDRVLMFENGEWQPLRPHAPALPIQRPQGLTEFHFGPEIAFGHELAEAFPDETIGIIKYGSGGSSIMVWKPDWSKADADRIGQGGVFI